MCSFETGEIVYARMIVGLTWQLYDVNILISATGNTRRLMCTLCAIFQSLKAMLIQPNFEINIFPCAFGLLFNNI